VIIRINETRRIRGTTIGWQVETRRQAGNKDGSERWHATGHFVSFENALESVTDSMIRGVSDEATTEEAIACLKTIRSEALTALAIFRELKP
jgi:hypothetical protein